jgi:hypothetical protein
MNVFYTNPKKWGQPTLRGTGQDAPQEQVRCYQFVRKIPGAYRPQGDLMTDKSFRLYGYRWAVLAVFMFINLTIQILWIAYAPT